MTHHPLQATAFALLLLAGCAAMPPTAGGTAAREASAAAEPMGFASTLRCGDRRATVGFVRRDGRDLMAMDIDGTRHVLRQVVAASGARYESTRDPTTSFWNKGERATVTVGGETWPECAMPGALIAPWRASGNEPGWQLQIAARLVFTAGDTRLDVPAPAPQVTADGRRYRASEGARSIDVTVANRRCADSMTGMPHPHSVEVRLDGKRFRGCGGSPADLLTGAEWVVEDIGGAGLVDRSRATLTFGDDGRVSGRASCNSFNARWTLTGERLSIDQAASTRKACPPALMDQERRFLAVLQNVMRFEIDASGALLLVDEQDRRIRARR